MVRLNDVGSGGVETGSSTGVARLGQGSAPAGYPPGRPTRGGIQYDTTDPTMMWRLDKQIGGSVGNDNGNSNFSLLAPLYWFDPNTMFFTDLHATATDNGRATFNGGAGVRRYVSSQDRVYTVAGYVDWDDGNEREYHQGSVHLGSAGRWFDFNANGYFRESDSINVVGQQLNRTPFFQGNQIMLGQTTRFEQSMSAVDAEFGVPIPGLARYGLSIYVGGYYLKGDRDQDAGGFQGRIEGNVNEDWKMSVSYSDDKLFGPNAWMNVILTLPDGIPHRWMRPQHGRAKMFNHVQRQNRIHVQQFEEIAQTPAINPIDGIAYRVLHLNPNAGTDGNGTVENPYNNGDSLVAGNTAATDILRIIPRADDTGTNLSFNGGITLFDNQRLLGSSTAHTFNEVTWGTMPLPGLTGGTLPWLSNSSATPGSVVMLAGNNEVSGFIVDGNYDDGAGDVATHYGISNAAAIVDFNINRSEIRNAPSGILLTDATGTGLLVGNQIHDNTDDGFSLTNSSGALTMTIGGPTVADGNLMYNNGDAAVDFVLNGTATADIDAQNNVNFKSVAGVGPGIGTNFVGSNYDDSGSFVPDTMGGVGPDHIVEMINGVYAIYDKTTGAQISTSSLDAFWTTAMGAATAGTFDPRIIYDTTTDRWIAAAIDGGNNNSVFIAVSATSDPTGGWTGVSFVANTDAGARFNDFDTLAVTGDAVVIGTNNYGAGFDVSVYSIPKADLMGGVPTVANMTRFENLNSGTVGSTLQGAVDFTAGTGEASLLSNSGTQIFATTITGTDAAGAVLGVTAPIAGITFAAAPGAQQPGGATDLENVSPRINGNVIKVNGSLWAVHAVSDPGTGRSALAWYEIDDASGTLLQSGLISDPTLDFLEGSIAVNPTGDVVIGFTGSGTGQFASSMAAIGTTAGGTTTFGTPMVLQAGVDTYEVEVLAGGRNRWGDYSATMVDPSDPDSFWTFQEFVDDTDSWAIAITQINMGGGTTLGGGNTGDYFRFTADGTSSIDSLNFRSNNLDSNGGAGLRMLTTGTGTITGTAIHGNVFANNGEGGVIGIANGGTLDINVGTLLPADANIFTNNADTSVGINLGGTSTGTFNVLNNTITGTTVAAGATDFGGNGSGIHVEVAGVDLTPLAGPFTFSTLTSSVIDANTIDGSAGNGIFALVREAGHITSITVGNTDGDDDNGNTITNSAGVAGINFRRTELGRVVSATITDNWITENVDGLRIFSENSGAAQTGGDDIYTVDDNNIFENTGDGIRLHTVADADLFVSMDNNIVDLNGAYGLQYTEQINSEADTRTLDGVWTNNLFTNNTNDGIYLNALVDTLEIGQAGNGNTIAGNGGLGVNIDDRGSSSLVDNDISNNAGGGVSLVATIDHTLLLTNNDITNNTGVGLEVFDNNSWSTVAVISSDNRINNNTDDGVQIRATSTTDYGSLTVSSTDDTINLNGGRGVDVLNQGDDDITISFTRANISSNAFEGFYVVNSASTNAADVTLQTTNNANGALASDGAVANDPRITLTLVDSIIFANGGSSTFSGTGLVVRVGTSDNSTSYTINNSISIADPGGFAATRGGVVGVVTGNIFTGNVGDDVTFQSYVSAAVPATTAGTWSDTVFTVTGIYETDPLARFDLSFGGNTGDSLDVSNWAGTFYNNAEGVFKSRLMTATDPGPFSSATRRRNATLLAFRGGAFTNPFTPGGASNAFLYPGLGDGLNTIPLVNPGSTFRVNDGGAGANTFSAGDSFTTQEFNGLLTGEFNFYWSTLP